MSGLVCFVLTTKFVFSIYIHINLVSDGPSLHVRVIIGGTSGRRLSAQSAQAAASLLTIVAAAWMLQCWQC